MVCRLRVEVHGDVGVHRFCCTMDLMCTKYNQYSMIRTCFGMVCSDGYLISSQCNMNFAMYNGAQLVLVKKRLFRANPGTVSIQYRRRVPNLINSSK
jgi:hypothetical protein